MANLRIELIGVGLGPTIYLSFRGRKNLAFCQIGLRNLMHHFMFSLESPRYAPISILKVDLFVGECPNKMFQRSFVNIYRFGVLIFLDSKSSYIVINSEVIFAK